MCSVICATFPAYTFAMLDNLPVAEVTDLAGAALWLREEEARAEQGAGGGRRNRRR